MYILQMCAQKAHKSKQDTYIGFILYKKRIEFAWLVILICSLYCMQHERVEARAWQRYVISVAIAYTRELFSRVFQNQVKKANKGQHPSKPTRTQTRNKWIVWGAGKREWKTYDLFGFSIWLVDWLFNAGFLVQSHIVEGETHWSAGIASVLIENFLIWKWEISMLFF